MPRLGERAIFPESGPSWITSPTQSLDSFGSESLSNYSASSERHYISWDLPLLVFRPHLRKSIMFSENGRSCNYAASRGAHDISWELSENNPSHRVLKTLNTRSGIFSFLTPFCVWKTILANTLCHSSLTPCVNHHEHPVLMSCWKLHACRWRSIPWKSNCRGLTPE